MSSPQSLSYFPIQKRWRRVGPIYRSDEAREVWLWEMVAFDEARCEERGLDFKLPNEEEIDFPRYFDSCDWRFCRDKPGPTPEFWNYACHSACHWTANLSLFVAQKAEPKRPWRLVSSNAHTTCWDGSEMLWDTNFMALGVPPNEAWELANDQPDSKHLEVGKFMWH